MKDEECMFRDCLKGGLSLSVFINRYISVCYLISVKVAGNASPQFANPQF